MEWPSPLSEAERLRYARQMIVPGIGWEGQVRLKEAEPPVPGSVPSCEEIGVLGMVPGIVGTLQAVEAMKLGLDLSA